MPLEIIIWSMPGNAVCKQICITYSFTVGSPTILGNFLLLARQDQLGENYLTYSEIWEWQHTLGNFLLLARQDQLGENYLTYSEIWESQNTLGKKYALHIRDIQALQINHVCEHFRPHGTVATEIKVKLIPQEYFVAFAFALILIGTDDHSHSCSHRYFTPNFTFAFAFVILDLINLEIVLFRFTLISVLMVLRENANH